MSINSLIGFLNKNNTVEVIYCHHDGNPSFNGALLEKYYQNPEKIKELLDLGDISSLAENVTPPEGKEHTFDNPYPGVVVAYHRDREEQMREASILQNKRDFMRYFEDSWCSYTYLYDRRFNIWIMLDAGMTKFSEYKKLLDVLEENEQWRDRV